MARTVEVVVKMKPDTSEIDKAMKKYTSVSIPTSGGGGKGVSKGTGDSGAAGGIMGLIGGPLGAALGGFVGGALGASGLLTNTILNRMLDGLNGILSILEGVGKMMGVLVATVSGLFVPLLMPILTYLSPIVKYLSVMLRPVMTAMQKGMQAGLQAGGATGAMSGALVGLFEGISAVALVIFGGIINTLGNLLFDAIYSSMQFIIIFVGGLMIDLMKLFGIMMGIDVTGFTNAIGNLTVNTVSAIEVMKQMSQLALDVAIGGNIDSMVNSMLGVAPAAIDVASKLSLSQVLLVGLANTLDLQLGTALTNAFVAINQTTDALRDFIAKQPTYADKVKAMDTVIQTFADNLIKGKDPVEAYGDAVLEVGTSADTATQQLNTLKSTLENLYPNRPGNTDQGLYSRMSPSSQGGVDLTTAGTILGGFLGATNPAFGPAGLIMGASAGRATGEAAQGVMDFISEYVPHMASGGTVKGDGLAYVHAGETVVPANSKSGVDINMPITINGGNGGLTDSQIKTILREVEIRLQSRKVASGGFA